MFMKSEYVGGAIRAFVSPLRIVTPHRAEFALLDEIRRKKQFLFVTGMHRSGTTFIAQRLANVPGMTGFHNVPGRMDEGQFLQRVFPLEVEYGGMGYFGYHPRSRLVEPGKNIAQNAGVCLLKDWMAYLDLDASVVVEKTPGNFRRCRFLASVFPNCCFVHMIRHPAATVLALKSFAPGAFGIRGRSFTALIRHWARCQAQALSDYKYLRQAGVSVVIITLEDIPEFLPRLCRILESHLGVPVPEQVLGAGMKLDINADYQLVYDSLRPAARRHGRSCNLLMERIGYSSDNLNMPPRYDAWLNT